MTCGIIRLICELPTSDCGWNWENSSGPVVFDVLPEEAESLKKRLAQNTSCHISEWHL